MKAKYFFGPSNDERCYDEDWWMDYMYDNELTELTVNEAKVARGVDVLYCSAYHDIREKGCCGKGCSRYSPRNGKNGICKHNRPVYEEGNKITLKLK